jgi:hypothetical protein
MVKCNKKVKGREPLKFRENKLKPWEADRKKIKPAWRAWLFGYEAACMSHILLLVSTLSFAAYIKKLRPHDEKSRNNTPKRRRHRLPHV